MKLYDLNKDIEENNEEKKLEIEENINNINIETTNKKEKIINNTLIVEEKNPIIVENILFVKENNINYNLMKVKELKKLCKERKIKGYYKLKKKELIELLNNS